jgi:hypothetical protein
MLDQSVLPSFRCLHVVIYDLTDEVMSKLTAGSKDCMKPLLIVRDTATAKISRGASKLISGVHYTGKQRAALPRAHVECLSF